MKCPKCHIQLSKENTTTEHVIDYQDGITKHVNIICNVCGYIIKSYNYDDMVKVKLFQNIQECEIIGVDGITYVLKPNSVITLPFANAMVLVKHGVGRLLE